MDTLLSLGGREGESGKHHQSVGDSGRMKELREGANVPQRTSEKHSVAHSIFMV